MEQGRARLKWNLYVTRKDREVRSLGEPTEIGRLARNVRDGTGTCHFLYQTQGCSFNFCQFLPVRYMGLPDR